MRNTSFVEIPKQFAVQIWWIGEIAGIAYFNGRVAALGIADRIWEDDDVYRVKVWDLRKGPIEPDNPNAVGLIKEYI